MFLTVEDFLIIPYSLPNLDRVENDFLEYCTVQEKDILKKLLGSSLYNAFIDACFVEGEEGDLTAKDDADIAQRWLDLRDGATFQYNGKDYEWQGVVKMLTPYVFAQRIKHTTETASGIGVTNPTAENSEVVTPAYQVLNANNEFADLAGDSYHIKDTLYGFLYNSDDTFTDSLGNGYDDIITYLNERFKSPGKMNILNL